MVTTLSTEQAKLVENNHNMIYSFMKKYKLSEEEWYDVVAIGLVKAAISYIPNEFKFSTYAYKCMYNEMCIEFKNQNKYWKDLLSLDYEYESNEGDDFNLGELFDDGSSMESKIINRINEEELYQFFISNLKNNVEKQVFDMLIQKCTQKQITEETGYSRYEVDNLKKRLARKYKSKYQTNLKLLNKSEESKSNILKVGDKVKVPGEKLKYIVRARDDRYIICTRQNNDNVWYFIIDLELGVRGEDNMIFCSGYVTDEECNTRLKELQNGTIQVSKKNSIKLDINVA